MKRIRNRIAWLWVALVCELDCRLNHRLGGREPGRFAAAVCKYYLYLESRGVGGWGAWPGDDDEEEAVR